jgi:hypothetical protein
MIIIMQRWGNALILLRLLLEEKQALYQAKTFFIISSKPGPVISGINSAISS